MTINLVSSLGARGLAVAASTSASASTSTTTETAGETTKGSTSTVASTASTRFLGDDGEDLFLDWLDLLDDLSGWSDDFTDFLDDWLGDGVFQHMGLILGGGFLVGSLGAIVHLLDVEVGRGRSEENVEWDLASADFDGGWGDGASRWDILELNLVSGLDGSVDDLASATGGATAHTAITAGGSAGTTVATRATAVSGDRSDESSDNEELHFDFKEKF